MANIFTKTNNYVDKPKRNVFDLSFQNNATFEFGKLYPVLCKEVLPGDSFKIDATFGLKFLPFYWPVQTRMKANLHFFYVRRRNLWKDFVDYWGNTKEGLVPPYLSFRDREMLKTGELADYLGVPTNIYGNFGSTATVSVSWPSVNNDNHVWLPEFTENGFPVMQQTNVINQEWVASYGNYVYRESSLINLSSYDTITSFIMRYNINSAKIIPVTLSLVFLNETFNLTTPISSNESGINSINIANLLFTRNSDNLSGFKLDDFKHLGNFYIVFKLLVGQVVDDSSSSFGITATMVGYNNNLRPSSVLDISSNDLINPYLPSNSNGKILISAEPFRAYEAIYNSFYRNPQNNPYILNGVKEYNKYIPTNDGGLDDNSYKLHFRNWESDFLTTATQTPQQGDFAPLVGVTSTGQMTFQDEDGNIYKAYADVSDDGTIKGLKVGETGLPAGTLHALVDSISTGISINDFRNVNALQRWLEKNLRRGYRFKDQIMSHFGVDVRYDELDMPEFIGGCSEDINVNQISNTNGAGDVPLGEYGAQASCVGTTRNAVSHYFDEPGYVMAILCISPVPNYSQLLPKYLIKRNLFDHYFPEFGHIGPQPILMKEVCPNQQFVEDPTKLDKVFGYQRAWYDYLASVDEVHGYFRSEMRNFLINRRFDVAPELSESFLLIDPDQVNDVFAVTDRTHKILGQIYFDIKAKRPIPEFGIPRLE